MLGLDNVQIRYAESADKDFWFLLDKHITYSEFENKIRDRRCYILFFCGRPAGILRYNLFWDNTPFCTLLFVLEEFRNRGLGKILMEHWEREMSASGYGSVLISTRSDEDAQHFYRKLGYKYCGNLTLRGEPQELFLDKRIINCVELTASNFNVNSLDDFIRRQKVSQCWRRDGEDYALKPVTYIEDWSLEERRQMAEKILNSLKGGSAAFGAVCGNEIVGFALINAGVFGSENQYIDLEEFYVSEPFRREGIGKALFNLACGAAKNFGAVKLYISAHSAMDSIAAYKSYGCVFAKEVNKILAEKEPFDLQLEFMLK